MEAQTSKGQNEAEKNAQEPLRVSQLDASELDSEVYEVLFAKFDNIFKYVKPKILLRYKPEIHASIRLLIWKYTIGAYESTIGQQLMELRYKNDLVTRTFQWMNKKQKILHAILTVGGPWVDERMEDLKTATESWPFADKIWLAIDWFAKFWKIAGLINFLVFLTKGRYQYMIERILGIRTVFPAAQGVRQVGFEYMDRELLWHGFAEFLFFVLPLINFRRIKNFLVRNLLTSTREKATGNAERTEDDFEECAICEETPFNPHEIGCRHVFCYYCIRSHYMADSSYTCPICGQAIGDVESIVPVRVELSKAVGEEGSESSEDGDESTEDGEPEDDDDEESSSEDEEGEEVEGEENRVQLEKQQGKQDDDDEEDSSSEDVEEEEEEEQEQEEEQELKKTEKQEDSDEDESSSEDEEEEEVQEVKKEDADDEESSSEDQEEEEELEENKEDETNKEKEHTST